MGGRLAMPLASMRANELSSNQAIGTGKWLRLVRFRHDRVARHVAAPTGSRWRSTLAAVRPAESNLNA
jgi:hypothetical protein